MNVNNIENRPAEVLQNAETGKCVVPLTIETVSDVHGIDDFVLNETPQVEPVKLMELAKLESKFMATFNGEREDLANERDYDVELAMMAIDHDWSLQETCDLLVMRQGGVKTDDKDVNYYNAIFAEARQRLGAKVADKDFEQLQSQAHEIIKCIEGGNVYPDKEQRTALIAYLSALFQIEIADMVKYGTQPAIYYICLAENQSIEANVKDITDVRRFKNLMADSVGDIPQRVEAKKWDIVCRIMLKCFRVDSDGIESALQSNEDTLQNYIIDKEKVDNLEDAIREKAIFKDINGNYYIYKADFIRYAQDKWYKKMSAQEANVMFKRLGFVSEQKKQRSCKKSLWRIPDKYIFEEEGA